MQICIKPLFLHIKVSQQLLPVLNESTGANTLWIMKERENFLWGQKHKHRLLRAQLTTLLLPKAD